MARSLCSHWLVGFSTSVLKEDFVSSYYHGDSLVDAELFSGKIRLPTIDVSEGHSQGGLGDKFTYQNCQPSKLYHFLPLPTNLLKYLVICLVQKPRGEPPPPTLGTNLDPVGLNSDPLGMNQGSLSYQVYIIIHNSAKEHFFYMNLSIPLSTVRC